MGLLIGDSRPNKVFLGANEVSKIYLGTDIVWQKQADVWTLFDGGYVNDVQWAGNVVPNPGASNYVNADLSAVSSGYMRLRIRQVNNISSTQYVNLSTVGLYNIPQGATKLKMDGSGYGRSPTMRLSLLVTNAANTADVGLGGAMTNLLTVSGSYVVQTLNLPENINRNIQYRIAITARGLTDYQRDYRIRKVWFE